MANYIKIEPILYKSTDDWLNSFLSSIKQRPSYYKEESIFRFNRMGIRVLGTPLEEDEYYNSLFDMKEKEFIHVLSEELDKTIENHVFQSLQEVLDVHLATPSGLSINRLVANMYGKNLIPKHNDPSFNRHIQLMVIKVMEHFKKAHNGDLTTPDFRRFFIDIVKWLKNHWEKWTENLILGDDLPKVVWYGELNKSQKYFLMLLMEFGCDVLLFHPEGKDLFTEIDDTDLLCIPYKYSSTSGLEPFPKEIRERKTTVAYRANKQLEKMMNHHESGIYKAWQFREYTTSSITMRMTYDDIFIYAKEMAMIRPEFKLENKEVHIPVIFSKVQGVSKNRKEYWEHIHELMEHPLALSVQKFPFMESTKANYHFHYQQALVKGSLSPTLITEGSWWRYKHLPNGLQNALAHTIKAYCENPKLKRLSTESEYDIQVFLFKQANSIPEVILQLLQKFDYSQDIPKIVLYSNEKSGEISREDAALLLFLNEFGIDIIHYNPAGHNDIENYIDEDYYDIHWLEDVVFEQEFQNPQKNKSVFKRLINRIF